MQPMHRSENDMLCELLANLKGPDAFHWQWAFQMLLKKQNPWPNPKFNWTRRVRPRYASVEEYVKAFQTVHCHLGSGAGALMHHVSFGSMEQEVIAVEMSLSQLGFDEASEASLERVFERGRWLGLTLLPDWAGLALFFSITPCTGDRLLVATQPIVGPGDKQMLFAIETNEQDCLFAYEYHAKTILSQFKYFFGCPAELVA